MPLPNIYGFNKTSEAGFNVFAPSVFVQGCNYQCPFCFNARLAKSEMRKDQIIPIETIEAFIGSDKPEMVMISGGEPLMLRRPACSCFESIACAIRVVPSTRNGHELTLPADQADGLWRKLVEAGVKPCGLGARDTLRLEAGMNLYGQDMDETVTPLESGLSWTVAMKDDRAFIGRRALEEQKASGVTRKLTGIVLLGRGVVRPGNKVHTDAGDGVLTSGSFSPTLQRAIGFARVPADAETNCQVDVRGKLLDAKMVRPPFARAGNVCSGII